MKDISFFEQILGLEKPWEITRLETDLENKSIYIYVEYPKDTKVVCPVCGSECSVYDYNEKREWHHLDIMQFKTFIRARVPRCDCKTDGVKTIKVSWSEVKSKYTLLFERFAIDILLTSSNQLKTANILGLTWNEIHYIQKRAVRRGEQRRKLSKIDYIGIDEKSFTKGHSYGTSLYNLDNSTVIDVIPDRTEEAAKKLLARLDENIKNNIKAVAMDMWVAYIKSVEECLPSSEIVHDKFHIAGYLNKAVDQVRRQENKALRKEGIDDLKGSKWLWLKNESNLTDKEVVTFEALKLKDLSVGKEILSNVVFINLSGDSTRFNSINKFPSNIYYCSIAPKLTHPFAF
jgi:transposase